MLKLGKGLSNNRVRVSLSVKHGSSNHCREGSSNSSNDDQDKGPGGEEGLDDQNSLLTSVGKVVISGRHEIILSGGVDDVDTHVNISRTSVQLGAVSGIGVDVSSTNLRKESGIIFTVGLSSEGKVGSICRVGEHSGRAGTSDVRVKARNRVRQVTDLNNVRSICSSSTFSSISSRVSVAASPLEVDVISSSEGEIVRLEVILSRRVGLHNVASLASDTHVKDTSSS